jgi:hypothetical protein
VRHRDALFPDLGPTATGPVDAVEDLLLAVGRERPTARVSVIVTLAIVLLLVLAEGLRDPAGPAAPDWSPVLADAHRLITFSVSVTRFLFIRPKL